MSTWSVPSGEGRPSIPRLTLVVRISTTTQTKGVLVEKHEHVRLAIVVNSVVHIVRARNLAEAKKRAAAIAVANR